MCSISLQLLFKIPLNPHSSALQMAVNSRSLQSVGQLILLSNCQFPFINRFRMKQPQEDSSICLRVFAILFAILIVLVAAAAIALIVYGYIYYKGIWSALGTYGLVGFIVLLVAVSLIILVALCVFCGTCCKNRCCSITAIVFIVIWIILLIGLGVVAIVLPPKYFSSTDESKCLQISVFGDLDNYASQSLDKSICYSCACYFHTATDPAVYTVEEQQQLLKDAPKLNTVDSSLPVRVQDCSANGLNTDDKLYKFFQTFEDKLKCTGWCQSSQSLYYHFTDVNNGKPPHSCYSQVSDRIRRYAKWITILAFVGAGLWIIDFIFLTCYVCSSRKRTLNPVQMSDSTQRLPYPAGGMYYDPRSPYPYG